MSWGYGKENGPANWYKDCPIAVNGKHQSPIDLIDPEVKRDSSLKPLKASYPPFPKSKILNNGHTAQFSPDATSNLSELSGGPLEKKYKFEQFHFHWGDKDSEGSEHRVNGKMYSAELHLVHWDCETHSNLKAAVGGGNPNDLSVLGFFLKVGAENAALKPITDMLSKVKKAGSSEALRREFNMEALLPKDLADYYTYDGSLTTPPLLECVKWIVFKEPLEVSAAQMQALRSIENGQGQPLVGNYRPPCPLHSRTVAASFT